LFAAEPLVRLVLEPEAAPDSDLEAVIRGTMQLTLQRSGFRFPATPPPGESPTPDGSDFLLSVRYSIHAQTITLTFLLTDAQGRKTMESRNLERTLDPLFDNAVAEVTQDLVRTMVAELASRAAPSGGSSRQAAENPASGPEVLGPDAPVLSRPAESSREALPEPPGNVSPESGAEIPAERPPSNLFAGAGAFLPLGTARDYFSLAAYLEGGWRSEPGRWRIGASAGFLAFLVGGTEPLLAYNFILMPGAEAGYLLVRGERFRAEVFAAAGPAVALVGGSGDFALKALPFCRAGFAADIRLSGRVRLSPGGAALLLLDYDGNSGSLNPIWGVLPRIIFSMEL